MKDLTEIINKLRAERDELGEKIEKLYYFLSYSTPEHYKILCDYPAYAQLTSTQYDIMHAYFKILDLRIEKLKSIQQQQTEEEQ